MPNYFYWIIVGLLVITIFFLTFFTLFEDSFTFDEVAHLPAGYSYLTQKDYRLNPEHPPLIKDITAFPLLFLNLNFPKDHPSWFQKEPPQWWTQFWFGNQFLYWSGNNPDKILIWGRLPMILILIFLALFCFYWTKQLFGKKPALLTLFLITFSPTLLAHGRLVTTDLGASLGVVLATYFWIKFLKKPNKKNIILAGLIFGLAMLIKFSLILLVPFFGIITLIYVWLCPPKFCEAKFGRAHLILKYLILSFLIGTIAIIFVIWPVYFYHTFNYPINQQIRDTQFILSTTNLPQFLIEFNTKLAANSFTRPLAHYLLGLSMVINRGTTGHTTYFLGEISAKSWREYFPIVYSIKEPLAFHILTLIALLFAAWLIKKPFWQSPFSRMKNWIKNHFGEFSMIFWVLFYWMVSINSNLNIGIRHLLPVYPFTIILVSAMIIKWLNSSQCPENGSRDIRLGKYLLLGGLLIWQALSVVSIFPHFLAYFNELVGGPNNGYLYVVDSNLDWGQDLKRLVKWVEKNKLKKIYLDYFGGGDPKYYLGEKYLPWEGKKNPKEFPKGNYLAVSANQLQGGRGKAIRGFDQPTDYYMWLNRYQPITKIGYSIFVYYIK